MTGITQHVFVYICAFIGLWIGSGLVIDPLVKLAKTWNTSAFALSFFVLGILTSLPEMTIGLQAVTHNDPIISVGNLLGGTIILFLCIIPLLGAAGNGVLLPTTLSRWQVITALTVCGIPALATVDGVLSSSEAIVCIVAYCLLPFLVTSRQKNTQNSAPTLLKNLPLSGALLLKILLGVIVLLIASSQIITSTEYFIATFEISTFFMSLIVVTVGSNMPELSLVLRSIINRQKDVALADYLGSASTNTVLLGLVTLSQDGIKLPSGNVPRSIFTLLTLVLFFVLLTSRKKLTRIESLVLLSLYVVFVYSQALLA